MDCMFCDINNNKIILENEGAFAIYDIFPVNMGHVLVIPKRHIETYFDAGKEDREYLWELVEKCKRYLDEKYKPDGYNVGINCEEAAGQTVKHLHIHLIPRFIGDMENPRGGVRGVIPEKRIY